MFKHNDYEILHLIKEGDNAALSLMFEKYKPLIYKNIFYFNLQYIIEDMFQEGMMVLHKSIKRFDPSYDKTFTKYFEQNLKRKFITYINKEVRRTEIFHENLKYIYEQNHCVQSSSVYYGIYKKEIAKILTKQELLVYTLRELKNYSIEYIAQNYELSDKTIYNSVYRAKQKIKEHFKN
jgi:RNA polymerase sporulation-specific sigma factor